MLGGFIRLLLHLPMLSTPAAFNIQRGCSCSLPARVGVIIVRSAFTNLFQFFRFFFILRLLVILISSVLRSAPPSLLNQHLSRIHSIPRLSRHLLTHNHLDGCCSNLTNNRKLPFLRPHSGGLSAKTTETATNATCHRLPLSLSQLVGRT